MSTIIPILLFIVMFLLFAMKREYVEMLIILIIMLILDFTMVKAFSTAPLLGGIVLSIGKPFVNILMYVIIKLMIMGIYYALLQKNNIGAIIGYLLINMVINKFLIAISGNILIDIIVNVIIGGIIFIVYQKTDYIKDLKWFAISAMIIDFILQISISFLFIR